jgi:hypothetical protein
MEAARLDPKHFTRRRTPHPANHRQFSALQSHLQNTPCKANFSRLGARAEGADGHFWHDTVIETKIITPAQWILPNPNGSCNGGT